MRIAVTKPLFAWDCLEDSPSLTTIKALLAAMADGKLLDGLRQARGHGRDDYCYDRSSQPMVRHPMAYNGYEASRGTIKYRCPARHEGWLCPHDAVCNAGKEYGRTVRVKCDIDLRRFPPIPRATKQFERLYNGRTAVERVNARLKPSGAPTTGTSLGRDASTLSSAPCCLCMPPSPRCWPNTHAAKGRWANSNLVRSRKHCRQP